MPISYLIPLDEGNAEREKAERMGRNDQAAICLINRLLEEGVPVQWALEDIRAGIRSYPAGTFFVQLPFETKSKMPCDVIMSWLEEEAKKEGLFCIEKTTEQLSAESRALVLPRIALFYDHTTYDNALMHFLAFRSMGFEAALVNALDLLKKESDPGSILAQSNVLVMPGGSMHFSSFSSEDDALQGIRNIRDFVRKGGGYIGICAGATEALAGNPYPRLNLVDASYHAEWFTTENSAAGDWEWRTLLGPLYLEVVEHCHPVMLGYGQQAPSSLQGPLIRMDYFGGPSMFDSGDSVTVLARYKAPIDQVPCDRVKDIWGSAAIVSSDFGSGKVVLFGPHPEWSESSYRMYAQAIYYVATKPRHSAPEASYCRNPPEGIAKERITAITQTAASALPILESCKRMCSAMVSLGAGDRSDPMGLWYDRTMLAYSEVLSDQMREIACYCQELEVDYIRLNAFKSRLGADAHAMQWIARGQNAIDRFFSYAERLPTEPHEVGGSGWKATKFPELLRVISHMEKEIIEVDLLCIIAYAKLFHRYKSLKACSIASPTQENIEAVEMMRLDISSFNPPGPLYKSMNTLRRTLDLMQYKIGSHLINLLYRADHAQKVFLIYDYALENLLAGKLK